MKKTNKPIADLCLTDPPLVPSTHYRATYRCGNCNVDSFRFVLKGHFTTEATPICNYCGCKIDNFPKLSHR